MPAELSALAVGVVVAPLLVALGTSIVSAVGLGAVALVVTWLVAAAHAVAADWIDGGRGDAEERDP